MSNPGEKKNSNGYGLSTKLVHCGNRPEHWTHSPIMPPIYMTTTFETREPGHADFEYSRSENPTRRELELHLSTSESANFALAFSSGLAALNNSALLLQSGQHILCCDDVYGGTNRFFTAAASRMGIKTTFIDGLEIGNWISNFRLGKTKMVWIESPTNPTMKIMDIEKIATEIKKLDSGCLVVVDNTFMTPVFQSPLKMGADIVMHSCTKYINGHSDVMMGALITNDEKLYDRLKFMQNTVGNVPSAFDCYMVLQRIKTLEIRVNRQATTAMKVAEFLDTHKYVEKVLYPGLKSHPQHDLAQKQYSGMGGMISIYINEGHGGESIKVVKAVKIFHIAVSLGCVSSLIEIPSLMTHSSVTEADRTKLNITTNLLRLSIGMENAEDLIEDLDQALRAAYE